MGNSESKIVFVSLWLRLIFSGLADSGYTDTGLTESERANAGSGGAGKTQYLSRFCLEGVGEVQSRLLIVADCSRERLGCGCGKERQCHRCRFLLEVGAEISEEIGNNREVDADSSPSDHIAARKKAGEQRLEPGVESGLIGGDGVGSSSCRSIRGSAAGSFSFRRSSSSGPRPQRYSSGEAGSVLNFYCLPGSMQTEVLEDWKSRTHSK